MGRTVYFPSLSFCTMPGLTSISSPTFNTPCMMDPPATPPCKSSTSQPGLLTSNERMTIMRGLHLKSRRGTRIVLHKYSHTMSKLYFNTAEMGMIGASPATVPATNFRISSCCCCAASAFTRSTLFCKMIMLSRRMISTAAKCSLVCG